MFKGRYVTGRERHFQVIHGLSLAPPLIVYWQVLSQQYKLNVEQLKRVVRAINSSDVKQVYLNIFSDVIRDRPTRALVLQRSVCRQFFWDNIYKPIQLQCTFLQLRLLGWFNGRLSGNDDGAQSQITGNSTFKHCLNLITQKCKIPYVSYVIVV